jgi:hypothetical protein
MLGATCLNQGIGATLRCSQFHVFFLNSARVRNFVSQGNQQPVLGVQHFNQSLQHPLLRHVLHICTCLCSEAMAMPPSLTVFLPGTGLQFFCQDS